MKKTKNDQDNAAKTKEIVIQRQKMLDDMNPALRKKIDEIVKWQKKDSKCNLVSRWELGSKVDTIVEDASKGCKVYGERSIEKISKFLGEGESVIRQASRIYNIYSEEEIETISEMVMADGITPISYSHVRLLVSLEKKDARDDALDLTIANCWTSSQLGDYVMSLNGGSRSNNPKGRVGKPKGVDAVIGQQLKFVEDFEDRNVRVWKDPETSLTTQLNKLSPVEYDQALVDKLAELSYKLRKLANEAIQRAEEAEQRYEEVKEVVDKGMNTDKYSTSDDYENASEDESSSALALAH